MMKSATLIILSVGLTIATASDDDLMPYYNYGEYVGEMAAFANEVTAGLEAAGMQVLGSYSPAGDAGKMVIVVTHETLLQAAAKGQMSAGFAAAMRVAITLQGEQLVLTSQNPVYWANAYFQEDYPKVEQEIEAFTERLVAALAPVGNFAMLTYGSSQELSARDLHKYHYMFGMPYFEDWVELGSHGSHAEAIEAVERNLAASQIATKVFEVTIPGKEVTLYGIALGGNTGETKFVPIIDIADQKHTAFLPYELLVMGGDIVMLHGRYRIALSFPDLTMGTFSKIMATPGQIKDIMETLAK